MICDYCEKSFSIDEKGSGGKNRLFCFTCLPAGLDRNQRNTQRNILYSKRMREHKESLGCSKCGYNRLGHALEWHHPDSMTKDFEPADTVKRSWKLYLIETAKCILLCSCCHKEVHAGM